MDQERLFSLAMCRPTNQRETANKVINNDTELLINKYAGKTWKEYTLFSDQSAALVYTLHTHIRSHIL